jgi:SAM-dependent methyltransferase
MCNSAVLSFVQRVLDAKDVAGKAVLEVGAFDVNGSPRPHIEGLGPSHYVGVDISAGPGVDEVLDVRDLVDRFGVGSFDVVISVEMLEHVHDWRRAISQMKRVLRPGGVLLLTTRSRGFPHHDYPHDFWRFELADVEEIFRDMLLEVNEPDLEEPGVLVRATRPATFAEADLSLMRLHSIIYGFRVRNTNAVLSRVAEARSKPRAVVRGAVLGILTDRSANWLRAVVRRAR